MQALAGKRALLVLDGAEAADDLPAVLAVAGTCGVLITTRRHEHAPDDSQDIEPLPRAESLDLLRAWAGQYAADESAANEIVRLLGSLPLALYLAGRYLAQRKQQAGAYAAWLHEKGTAALHFGEWPRKSFPLLMQSSLAQVSASARAAFGVVGVLAFAPFEQEIVAAALQVTPAAAGHALGELVDYGLLLRSDDSYQATHAFTHSYARVQVTVDTDTIARLALYYAAFAGAESKKGLPGYAVLDRHRAHIVVVQAAALKAERWEAARQITWNVRDYLDLQGYWTDQITIIQAGIDAARAANNRYDEGVFLTSLGLVYAALGEPRRAIELHEQRLVTAREIGDRRAEGNALGNLGLAYSDLGEVRRAIELYEQQLVITREIGDRRGEGNALGNLGPSYATVGEPRRAIDLHERQLVITREIGDRRGEGAALGNLASAYYRLGEQRRAIELYEQRLVVAREIGDRRGEGNALGGLGAAYHSLGEVRRAIGLYEQQLVITREIGDRRGEGHALGSLGLAYAALGAPRRAIGLYEQQLVITREIGDRGGEGYALGSLGLAYAALGEVRRAISLYEQQLVITREIGDRRGEAIGGWNLGLAYEKEGDLTRAAANMQVRIDYEQQIGHPDAAAHEQRMAALKARAGL